MSQDTFHSNKWGSLHFYPVDGKKNPCNNCILKLNSEDCYNAPCAPWEREDGKKGYFSIHQMPKQ